MGRINFADTLKPDERAVIDDCIREHQYYNVDAVHAKLQSLGVAASRSAIGRYIKAQRELKAALPVLTTPTVITIVDCHSGRVDVVQTAASATAIRDLLKQPK